MKHKSVNALGVSAFCESMAMMLQAGIRTDEAISMLVEESGTGGALSVALKQAGTLVENGTPVAQALEETGAFPAHLVRMVRLGEQKGQMEGVFAQMAQYYARQDDIAQKLRALVRYPAAMVVIVAAVLGVMLAWVLPMFAGVYDSMTGSLSASAFNYIFIAETICWIALGVMLAVLVLLAVGLCLWRSAGGRAAIDRLLEKLPFVAGIMNCLGLCRFFDYLRVAMAAGENQDAAMQQASEAADCAALEEKLTACARRMEHGEGIAQAAYHVQLLEPVYGRMLLAGARSGNLDESLGRMGELLGKELTQRVERLVGLLDPILSGVMLATVGLSLLSVMLPLVGIISAIG